MQDPAYRGIDGNATLIWIEFLIQDYGSSKLVMYDTGMADSFANPTAHTATNGYFSNKIVGDIDSDRDVDGVDFGIFAPSYGSSAGQPAYVLECDLDLDGDVDGVDFGLFAPNYGTSIP
jgi:hypothetical protein